MYLPLQKNVVAEDKPVLEYMPYIGEHKVDSLVKELAQVYSELPSLENQSERTNKAKAQELYREVKRCLGNTLDDESIEEALFGILDLGVPKKTFCAYLREDSPPPPPESHFCRRCFLYGCMLHPETITPAGPLINLCDVLETSSEPCGVNCSKNGEAANKEPQVWTEEEESRYRLFRSIYANNFCKISEGIETKTCQEVEEHAHIVADELIDVKPIIPQMKASKPKAKNQLFNTVKKSGGVINSDYMPCDHKGVCANGCPCFDNKTFCEKFCKCLIDCEKRFQGKKS